MKRLRSIAAVSAALVLLFSSCSGSFQRVPGSGTSSSDIDGQLGLSSRNISLAGSYSFRAGSASAAASARSDSGYVLLAYPEEESSSWAPIEFTDSKGRNVLIADPAVFPIDGSAFFCRTGQLIITEEKTVVTEETVILEDGTEAVVEKISIEPVETVYDNIVFYIDVMSNSAWIVNRDIGFDPEYDKYYTTEGNIYLKLATGRGSAMYLLNRSNPAAGLKPLTSSSLDVRSVVAYSEDYIIATGLGDDSYGYIIDVKGRYPYASAPKDVHEETATYVPSPGTVGNYTFEFMSGKLVNAMISPGGVIYDIYGMDSDEIRPYYNESAVVTAFTEDSEFTFKAGPSKYIPLCSEIYGNYGQMFLHPHAIKVFTEGNEVCCLFYCVDNDGFHPALGELIGDDNGNVELRSVMLPEGSLHGIGSGNFNPQIAGHKVTFISTEHNAIFVVDLEKESYEMIKTSGRVADNEIVFSEDGTVIFHQYFNAVDVGTFRMNINNPTGTPELLSIDRMDLYQVVSLEEM